MNRNRAIEIEDDKMIELAEYKTVDIILEN